MQKDNSDVLKRIKQVEDDLDDDSKDDPEEIVSAENMCVKCDFKCVGEITMKKHVNTKPASKDKDKSEKSKDIEDVDLENFFQLEFVDCEALFACNICNEGVENVGAIIQHIKENPAYGRH